MRVVVFDGECVICNRSVQWLVRLDRRGVFQVAARQDPAVAALMEGIEEDSMVLVDGGERYVRSAAVVRILAGLGLPWSVLAALARLFPRGLLDRLYAALASVRYRWFGRQEYCEEPSPELRARVYGHAG